MHGIYPLNLYPIFLQNLNSKFLPHSYKIEKGLGVGELGSRGADTAFQRS